MLLLTLLVGVIGVTTAHQSNSWDSQWPTSNHIYGQLDFRYPDWVLNPRPPCVQEGVFPHPRSHNCTWYYRCVARVGVPRYSTFYFECEPGTMFDDDLDQCVHPHSGYNCQGPTLPPPPPPPCKILPEFCHNYAIGCGTSTKHLCQKEICPPMGVKDICSGGQFWEVATRRCVNKPATETCCEIVRESCKEFKVCPQGGSSYVQTLCERERCYSGSRDAFERIMCNTHHLNNAKQLYDTKQRTCVTPPTEDKCRDCKYTATNCREYDLCNPSGFKRLCDCSDCGDGMIYDPSASRCISRTAICPVLECVFRDSVCNCVTGMSLCTGCYMRGNFIPVSQFCKAQSNPVFYHVEKDECLHSNPGFLRATPGHCPRTRDSLGEPALQCSLRDNSIIRCWSDDIN